MSYLKLYQRYRRNLGDGHRKAFRRLMDTRAKMRAEQKRKPSTERYDEHCEATIGPSGACLGSMSGYRRAHPDHDVGKNQCLVKKGKMFWYGDIDYTVSIGGLMSLAERIGPFDIYEEPWCHGPDRRKGMKPRRTIYGYD